MVRILALVSALVGFAFVPMQELGAATKTQWSSGHKSQARLIVGAISSQDGSAELYAGVEVKMAEGWKTYWRHPGEAGGVPPYFDWSKSNNLADTKVLFPAPHRFQEAVGDAIGYKSHVVLPIRFKAADPALPVGLALNFQYGVCREICIPAEANLVLRISPDHMRVMPSQLAEALRLVSAQGVAAGESSPYIKRIEMRVQKAKPALVLDARFPQGIAGADVFIEALDDIYLPMAQRVSQPSPDVLRYRVDLSNGIDISALAGRKLRLTLVSDAANSEVEKILP